MLLAVYASLLAQFISLRLSPITDNDAFAMSAIADGFHRKTNAGTLQVNFEAKQKVSLHKKRRDRK